MKFSNLKIQDLLSLGYLYLLFLGILKDSIYYWSAGLNILNYSSLLDVLISPFSYVTEKPIHFTCLVVLIFGFYKFSQTKLFKKFDKKSKLKLEEKTSSEKLSQKENRMDSMIFLFIIGSASFYLGAGIGRGHTMYTKLRDKEFKMVDHIQFMDGEEKNVKVIGENSTYIFFVEKNNDFVSISPINGAIKRIQKHRKESK